MNSSFPKMPTLLDAMPAQQRPFEWIGDLSGFLRRNLVVLVPSVGCMVLSSLIYLAIAKPRFTASTTLLVDEKQSELFQQHPTVADAQIENALIESKVEILRSAGLARKVVTRLDLADDPEFGQHATLLERLGVWLPLSRSPASNTVTTADAAEDRRVTQFLSMVVPHRIGLTYVIEIDATASSPVLAAKLANGLADAYIAEQLEVKDLSARKAAGWLETMLLQLQQKALKADQAAQLFKSQNGIVDTDHGLLNEQQLTELNSQLIAARGKTAEARARLDRIRQVTDSQDGSAMATSDMLSSPVISGLRERYLNDAQHVAEWSARYGRDHGAAVLLRKEMAELQASISSEIQRIEATAESDLEVDRAREAAIEVQLDVVIGRSGKTDNARAKLRSLQSAADTYRSLYVTFLQRAMQTAQDESFPVSDARVVTLARPPLTKSKPQGKLIVAGATIVGLGIGFVLGLLREALDRRIRRASDLTSQTGLSCLASLPNVAPRSNRFTSWLPRNSRHDRNVTAAAELGEYAAEHPETPFGRGISRLQLRLQQRADIGRGRLIGLISPTESAGTTTIATNLVRSFTGYGYNSELLDLSDCTGSRRQIRERLDLLRRSHDVVVIDFPPLCRPGEAHAVFADVDEMTLLVDAGRLDGAALLDCLRDGGLDPRMLSGAVLNNVSSRLLS